MPLTLTGTATDGAAWSRSIIIFSSVVVLNFVLCGVSEEHYQNGSGLGIYGTMLMFSLHSSLIRATTKGHCLEINANMLLPFQLARSITRLQGCKLLHTAQRSGELPPA